MMLKIYKEVDDELYLRIGELKFDHCQLIKRISY